MSVNIATNEGYTGLLKTITQDKHLDPADVLDDLEESHDQLEVNMSGLGDAVREASKGVSEKTSQEYLRCDLIKLDGTPVLEERSTYTHAQKMRAAATFGFGKIHGLGMQAWHQSEISGKMLGNPSVSETVSTYMLSLRRRKTQKGDTPISARAVSSDLLEDLYHFNSQPRYQVPQTFQSSFQPARKGELGPHARASMDLGYSLAFCGLLCVDELLKIQLQDLTLTENPLTGESKLSLQLPFRKTSQFGDIKPFVFYEMPDEYQHICVVRAFARWILASGLTEGYLFRKIRANDRIAEENEPMTSEQFLEMFRNNLLDVGVDFVPYGTHSFRRGGCQWLSVERRWPLRQICEWGGWSQEFTHLTIVKYLISWNDNPHVDRDDFFNMKRAPAKVCPTCNRSCHCA
ncbi:DNA breaking-rejoining enzyme [Lentinula novae-zelandiae]|nr:DNA breaking-rejoining enzyme [Lentinula novae-zelandiae]